ncbi:2Fe-2S iron-sulfur cluster-binding protein [Paeniglutamicibacter sp. ZC-3]|uniref:2Fe-2S iron-sulfur cluster-binding protein n=1 Tax=Paeniglutamicibacter sp. ZC-3 TaxID=2986919 RepID=UPI0021F6D20A|nr:2Fe-2S iron-sulfur cluster-binding protein [Paeniglutamicibacter sp. ZC-3]MCV9993346.1 2Fe-2S iron-sulfur cluster-binding protein [Paeniglutamicibacter sp. ZC-3]
MITATFNSASGGTELVQLEPGVSIMKAAILNGVGNIVGECGGQAMCATCHVIVRPEYRGQLPPIGEDEDEMLDCAATARTEGSRLGCQLKAGEHFSAIAVDLPETQ